MSNLLKNPSSFRDRSGFVYNYKDKLFRTVNFSFKDNFDYFISSGLYDELVKKGLLISHKESSVNLLGSNKNVYKLLKPEIIPFISYPYEWSQSMLLKAGQLTLEIEKMALQYGMNLKDASAYNVQFVGSKAIFIDTLSFEKIKPGKPWTAYGQFCRHFLAPLALMKYRDLRMGKLSSVFLDGIDLDFAAKLLPFKSYLNFHLFFNLYLHNFGQHVLGEKREILKRRNFTKNDLSNLIESLENALLSLKINKNNSFWIGYYKDNNYADISVSKKVEIVTSWLKKIKPRLLADLGANTGFYTRIASSFSQHVIAIDIDPATVNENFHISKYEKIDNILTLVSDLSNPSPGIGWENMERQSLLVRLHVDCVMALALIHHLYFTNDLNFKKIAILFKNMTDYLIIEFIAPNDVQIKRLIGFKSLDLSDYTENNFLFAFKKYFKIIHRYEITGSKRLMFLMKKINV